MPHRALHRPCAVAGAGGPKHGGLQGWCDLVLCPQGDALGMQPRVDHPPPTPTSPLHTFREGRGLSVVGGRCWCSHSVSMAKISLLGFFSQIPSSRSQGILCGSFKVLQARAVVRRHPGVGSTQCKGVPKTAWILSQFWMLSLLIFSFPALLRATHRYVLFSQSQQGSRAEKGQDGCV